MLKKTSPYFSIIIAAIGAIFLVNGFILAWNPPDSSPPDGNVAAPINVGDVGQYKTGQAGFSTGGLDPSYGLTVGNNATLGIKSDKESWFGDNLTVQGEIRFGDGAVYNDLIMGTDSVLPGYNQTNFITPLTIPGSGLVKTALYLKNAESTGTNRIDLVVDGDVRASSFRTYGGNGLYNEGYNISLYPYNENYWTLRSGRGVMFRDNGGSIRGYIYHNSSNDFGLLDKDGSWRLKVNPNGVYLPTAVYLPTMPDCSGKLYTDSAGRVLCGDININTTPTFSDCAWSAGSGAQNTACSCPSGKVMTAVQIRQTAAFGNEWREQDTPWCYCCNISF